MTRAGLKEATAASVRRANGYRALALALAPPGRWSDEDQAALRQGISDWDEAWQEAGRDLLAALDAVGNEREALEVAHARLFVGPYEILAPPHASQYLERDGHLMGEVSRAVSRAYAEAGLGPAADAHQVPDHVSLELEFMYYIAFEECTTGDSGWTQRRRRFWQEHLGTWLPVFGERIRAASVHPFYDAAARLLSALASFEERQEESGAAVAPAPASD